MLDKFSKANGFPKSQNIEPWDISYWSELLRKEKLNLDQESLRPWFPLNDVLKGLFKLSEKLFEIKVVEATDRHLSGMMTFYFLISSIKKMTK